MSNKLGVNLLIILLIGYGSNANAQLNTKEYKIDTQISDYAHRVLFEESLKTKLLFKMGGLQVWSILLPDQRPEIAFTTEEGLLIRGKIFGPEGEDIFASLTSVDPLKPRSATRNDKVPPTKPPVPEAETVPTIRGLPPASTTATFDARAASGMDEQSVPTFNTLAELRDQADSYSMWIQANRFKERAPVLYMLADPRCPFCAKSLVELKPYLDRGEIELRIIPTPVLSALSFQLAVSFVQDKNPGETFIKHSEDMLNGELERTPLPVNQMDKNVIKAMTKNVKWFRKNRLNSVPFYLYKTDQGNQIFYGQISEEKIKAIVSAGKADGRGKNEQ
ncbi:thioredoxin fold domain-containing protein [Ochrobactrum sp. BTU1]|uniref:thioredoxin fold domain-containing protein n=1 Tax=Ochrobactrum sp. BTU1 TaxID=2840456 RepID=UPI001C045E80|nr:thioredoxin fold domain-containing protein [Ochrobactrum sp. BTU1]